MRGDVEISKKKRNKEKTDEEEGERKGCLSARRRPAPFSRDRIYSSEVKKGGQGVDEGAGYSNNKKKKIVLLGSSV